MKKLFLAFFSIITLLLISCEDEEVITVDNVRTVETEVERIVEVEVGEVNDPTDDLTPNFSFTNEENTFSFQNLTEDFVELLWFFGDSANICNTENPTYIFGSELSEIEVTLRATNEAGEDFTNTQTITAPVIIDEGDAIIIDGSFDDWNDVDALVDESAIAGGSMKILKILAIGDLINIYLEGNTTMTIPVMDIVINTDEDSLTGYTANDIWTEEAGGEFLYEGPIASDGWGSFYTYSGVDGLWGWTSIPDSAAGMKSTGVVNIDENTNGVEFSIDKSLLGTLGSTLSIGFFENRELTKYLPSTTSLVTYTLPIEDDVMDEDEVIVEETEASIVCE